ncbi:MaoC family dehydratase [Marivibrio halodurans]|uniref:MaoC family dehydratase n=1 Tax=Marivibrio halodurans TaxID=2039722 RepID=A0A8J7V274_9PROT|nr:MaoC/PaaZ C-terminal domain-containing protein [Marivibrio halodurans]MBP5858541.1 MaoC family dehydratase [Marivibrio halodurans]
MADHRLTRDAIRDYAALSHDFNPLHVDEEIAAASPFGGIVAHGFLLLTGALDAAGATSGYPKTVACKFRHPGRPGDTLRVVVDGDGTFRVLCDDRLLVEGRIET